jgi:hypothetical protein
MLSGQLDAHDRLGAEPVRGLQDQHARVHHGEGMSHLSGMAVRYRKLRRDEPFDVLAELDVALDMDDQEHAMRELQHRAAAYHPDLIIDIHYEHGEGGAGEKIHLRGRAIRYRASELGSSGAMP